MIHAISIAEAKCLMISKKGESVFTAVLEPVSVCNSASPPYRLPDTFPQTHLPEVILVLIFAAASDKNPNSNQLKKRKRNLFAHKTEVSRTQAGFRYGLIQVQHDFIGMARLSLDFSILLR